jgi:hypothetical protein
MSGVIHKKVGPADKRSQRAWRIEHRVKLKAESSKQDNNFWRGPVAALYKKLTDLNLITKKGGKCV